MAASSSTTTTLTPPCRVSTFGIRSLTSTTSSPMCRTCLPMELLSALLLLEAATTAAAVGGPFIVAFAGVNGHGDAVHADFYSSETREWSLELYIYVGEGLELKEDRPAVLVGDSLYFVGTSGFLVRYWYSPLLRLGYPNMLKAGIRSTDIVTMIEPPKTKHLGQVMVMTGEDGGLGLASLYGNKISLWLRETGTDGAAGWVQRRTIDLKMLLPLFNPKRRACLGGVIPERANIIFVSTEDDIFRIELASLQARKVSKVGTDVKTIYPFVSFYTETLLVWFPSYFPIRFWLIMVWKHL
ncbi:hypothetical protein QOZ80_4BG0348800 [Eleusine coracana subsp. coracana]|nr:hypothetical protein QOZ80_4BG0348800 [Eleusine coracana subsp. coracana]